MILIVCISRSKDAQSGRRHGDNAVSIASNAGHRHLAEALKVYVREIPRACLLSAACTIFAPNWFYSRQTTHSMRDACIISRAASLCSDGNIILSQRLLILRSRTIMQLLAYSFCQRRSFGKKFGRMLLAYCGSTLVYQLMHHNPEIGDVLSF